MPSSNDLCALCPLFECDKSSSACLLKYGKKAVIDRSEYSKHKQEALLNGISKNAFESRIKNGWSYEMASTMPMYEVSRYWYKGSMLTVSELADIAQVSYTTMRSRLKSGMSASDAVSEKTMTKSEAGKLGCKRRWSIKRYKEETR